MEEFKIKKGSRLDLQVVAQDTTSVSATIILRSQVEGSSPVEFTENFVNLIADFVNVEAISDLDVGFYDVQINENYATGQPDKYPNSDDCDGDCTFLVLQICESLDD